MPACSILVFHPGALGDVVATFSNLLALTARTACRLDGVCQGRIGRLAAALGIFHHTVDVSAAMFASLYADDAGTASPALKAFFRPYREAVLFSDSEPLARGVARVFPNPVHRVSPRPPKSRRVHVHDHVSDRLRAAGLLSHSDGAGPLPPGFPPLKKPPLAGAGRFNILLHPGSGSVRKNWPAEKFTSLALQLAREGMTPSFIIGPAEVRLSGRLRAADPSARVHAPRTLLELKDLLLAGDAYVGNDSGVSHLAAFLGLPTLVFFGPSDPLRWRPRGRLVAVLSGPCDDTAPCFETGPGNCTGEPCITGITVDAAAAALLDLLSAAGGDGQAKKR